MEESKKKFCVAVWFSGFFGLAALAHLLRFVLRVPVVVGTFDVPLGLSALVAVVLGILSVGLLIFGKRCVHERYRKY